jgi:hypothetical protein
MGKASAIIGTRGLAVLAAAGLCASGCGGGTTGPSTPQPASSGATAPAATSPAATSPAATSPAAAGTETPPPGDIPDTTAYVAYRPGSGQYEVKVPEGWARTASPAGVSFTDKLNTITIRTARAAAPTAASARAGEVPAIRRSLRGFTLSGLSVVSRPAGSVILIRYSADSQPDPVTGKVYRDAFERYEFFRKGTEAVVTLAGPSGADNVDPWRAVTDSFRWLR